jgi:hypothetical protein
VGYSEEAFNEAVEKVSAVLKKANFQPKAVPFVPVSALEGENLTKPSTKVTHPPNASNRDPVAASLPLSHVLPYFLFPFERRSDEEKICWNYRMIPVIQLIGIS